MNFALKEMFLRLWKEYFDDAELPIVFYYTDDEKIAENDPTTSGQCLIANLVKVRKGTPLRFGARASTRTQQPNSFSPDETIATFI